jgi:hypothetical protein
MNAIHLNNMGIIAFEYGNQSPGHAMLSASASCTRQKMDATHYLLSKVFLQRWSKLKPAMPQPSKSFN